MLVHLDLCYLIYNLNRVLRILKIKKYSLLIVCAFSKWVDIIPLDKTTSRYVWEAFENEFIYKKGASLTLILDNGPEFIAHFKDDCE